MEQLTRLAAALMEVDGSITLVATGERVLQLRAGNVDVVLLDVQSLGAFEADVAAISAAIKPGETLVFVALDAQRFGAHLVLDRVLPSTFTQVRSRITAYVVVPGEKTVAVRGSTWRSLDQALEAIAQGRIRDPRAVIERRAAMATDVQTFMGPLMKRRPVVTYAVAGLSLALFGLQLWWGGGEPYVAAPRMGASIRSLVVAGEWWRLLAPMVLHGNIAHLAMNMIALFGFGTFLERFLGWRRYLLLYVLSGLGGSIASLLRPTEVMSVGASGGIWGLMLAGAVLVTWPRGLLPPLVSQVQKRRAWVPVVINFLYSFQPGIDLLAHFGGGAIGGLLVFTGLITRGIPRAETSNHAEHPPLREGLAVKASALVAAVALVVSVLAAIAMGRPWDLLAPPALETVRLGNATAVLPRLTNPAKLQPDGHTWVYGALQSDAVAFVVIVPEAKLSDEEAEDPEGAMQSAVPHFNPGLIDGFTEDVKTEVRHHEGRPYLYTRQRARDGRVAESYFLIDGHQMANVMVLTSKGASEEWRAAASAAPFSVKVE